MSSQLNKRYDKDIVVLRHSNVEMLHVVGLKPRSEPHGGAREKVSHYSSSCHSQNIHVCTKFCQVMVHLSQQ